MANYPDSIANLRTVEDRGGVVYDADKKTVFYAKDINDIIAEVEAIETALGINPEGSFDNIVARLEAIEAMLVVRIGTVADAATITPTGDDSDQYNVTALAQAAAIAAPSGTPVNGQKLIIRIKDNGTARALSWNAIYRVIGCTLPTTTVLGKTHYIGCIYNNEDSKWDVVAAITQA